MKTLLRAENVNFNFGTRRILKDVSLTVNGGEFVGLIGANGSGKTTLLRVLLALLKPSSGEIRLGETLITDLNRREIALRGAFVQQETLVDFDFTAREIAAMGRTPHLGRFAPEQTKDRAAIESAMRATETIDFADRLITELSGGERQRVQLARALAQETALILLDEPTSHLDLTHQFEVLETVRRFTVNHERAALAAIHDLSLAARFCHRLLMLSNGEIVAQGTPTEVLTEQNLANYFGLRARVRHDDEINNLTVIPLAAL